MSNLVCETAGSVKKEDRSLPSFTIESPVAPEVIKLANSAEKDLKAKLAKSDKMYEKFVRPSLFLVFSLGGGSLTDKYLMSPIDFWVYDCILFAFWGALGLLLGSITYFSYSEKQKEKGGLAQLELFNPVDELDYVQLMDNVDLVEVEAFRNKLIQMGRDSLCVGEYEVLSEFWRKQKSESYKAKKQFFSTESTAG